MILCFLYKANQTCDIYIYAYIPKEKRFLVLLCVFINPYHYVRTARLKGLNQAKIINMSVILLQKLFYFCAAHLPVRLDIETKFPISYFGHACPK